MSLGPKSAKPPRPTRRRAKKSGNPSLARSCSDRDSLRWPIGNAIEVAAQRVASWEEFVPVPVAPHRLEGELVVRPMRVDARAGVRVPVPHAAVPGARVADPHSETLVAQAPQRVQAAEPCAH